MLAKDIVAMFETNKQAEIKKVNADIENWGNDFHMKLNSILEPIGVKTELDIEKLKTCNYINHISSLHTKYEPDITNEKYHEGGMFNDTYLQGSNFKLYDDGTYEIHIGDVADINELNTLHTEMQAIQSQIKLVKNVNESVKTLLQECNKEYFKLVELYKVKLYQINSNLIKNYVLKYIEMNGNIIKFNQDFKTNNETTDRIITIDRPIIVTNVGDVCDIQKGQSFYTISIGNLWNAILKYT